MDLFTILGKIAVNNSDANNAIDDTTNKAKSFSEKLSNGFETVGEKATNVGKKLSVGLTAPIMGIGSLAIKTASDFEASMSEVAAISGATGDDFTALENKAKEMGATTKFSASESAEALKYMAMAGWKTEDMLNGLDGVLNLAAASGADLGTTSDIVTDALTAMGYSAGDAGRLADVMAAASSNANTNVELMGETFKYAGTMAGTMGYSMEDVSLAIGLMANSGIKGSMAGTSLNAIISRLATNTNGATECINDLGVEFYNADGTARNFGDVMSELREATKGLTTEEKAEIASTVAGEEAKKGFLAILNASTEDYDKLSVAINNSTGSAKEMADTMNDNLNGQLTLLKSQLEGLAIQFVTLIMPYLKQGVEWISKVCDWIAGLDENTQRIIITIVGLLAAAGPVLILFGKVSTGIGSIIQIGGSLIGGIGKIAPAVTGLIGTGGKLVGGIGSLVGKLGSSLLPAIAAIPAPVWIVIAVIGALVAAGVLLYKNWDEIKEWGQKTWASIQDIVGKAVDGIKNFFSGIIDFVKDNWQGLALLLVNPFVGGFKLLYDNCDSFRNFVDNFLGNLKEGFHNFVSNISEKAGELKDKVVSKAEELKDGAVENFHELKDRATEKINEMKEKVTSGVQDLKEKAVNKIHELKEDGVNKFNELKEKVSEKVSSLKESAVSKFNELKDSAVSKLSELKENGVSKFNELKDKGIEKMTSLGEKTVGLINSMKDKGLDGFQKLQAGSAETFEKLRSGIQEKMDKAKEIVSGAVDKLKSFFDFEWKLPHIKLPHFSMEGSFSLDPPSIPHIGVEWYKKAMNRPVIMDRPTAFGINPSGQIMAGGEAGSEIVSGTDTLMNMISAAVAENNDGLHSILEAIYQLLSTFLPELANMKVVMDTGDLVGVLTVPMSSALGEIVRRKGRGV